MNESHEHIYIARGEGVGLALDLHGNNTGSKRDKHWMDRHKRLETERSR
jgi:hypothetical protein